MPTEPLAASPSMPGPPPALWPAAWISHPTARQEPNGVYHFRKHFDLAAVPATFRVRVTADNRYQLFVNGTRVSSGPARGDIAHWPYTTLDLAPYLHAGSNVLAAITWYLDDSLAPLAQMGHAPGFLLCGEAGETAAQTVNTPQGWRCLRNPGYSFIPLDRREIPYYCVVGPGEQVDADRYPWGWEQPGFDDSAWARPVPMTPGSPRGARDAPSPWMLVPDTLPPMEEGPQPVLAVVRSEGILVENHRLAPDATIAIPANQKVVLLLDNGHLTTGYPELEVSGGQGATVRLRYAEAMWGGPNHNQKDNRNIFEGKVLRGYHDTLLADGERRVFRPLWWRTFRYLQIEVETASQPLTLHRLTNVFTAYPFVERGRFAADDESLRKIWEVGWRTARLCAHETYMDCPYYEQLQYGGDTRIQCLISLYVAGDDRLVRNAISQLNDSRLPDGITHSRYPSRLTQIIPPFALWWIGMIHDYWMFRDDPAFVRSVLPGARATLEWFLSQYTVEGLLGPLPWWNFVDWARVFSGGVPPGANEGGSSILSLQTVLALRETADIEQALGWPEAARRYRDQAKQISAAVLRQCWDRQRGLLADTPHKDRFSQHANILGILTDTLSGTQAHAVAQQIEAIPPISSGRRGGPTTAETPAAMAQATFYFRFYLHRALRKVGLGDHYLAWLDPWRRMLALGLTTWAEEPEPTRSDCHAWSAHPNVDLLATVLGVEPAAPGFTRVRVAPHLGPLQWAEGAVPHPRGEVIVQLRREGDRLNTTITLPPGVDGLLTYKSKEYPLHPGEQQQVI